jgi:hypothetical protein
MALRYFQDDAVRNISYIAGAVIETNSPKMKRNTQQVTITNHQNTSQRKRNRNKLPRGKTRAEIVEPLTTHNATFLSMSRPDDPVIGDTNEPRHAASRSNPLATLKTKTAITHGLHRPCIVEIDSRKETHNNTSQRKRGNRNNQQRQRRSHIDYREKRPADEDEKPSKKISCQKISPQQSSFGSGGSAMQ